VKRGYSGAALVGCVLLLGVGVRADPYQGVTPGGTHDPPRSEAVFRTSQPLMTWPGFQMLPGGGSRVFIQVSSEPRFETRDEPGRFVILLEGTGVHLRNTRRPLETRYFNTPVKRVRVERRGKQVAVILELRAEAAPRVRTKAGPDGRFHYVLVDFPAGQWIEGAEPPSSGDRPKEPAAPSPRSGDQAGDRERPPR
jgi:hypothetical protein